MTGLPTSVKLGFMDPDVALDEIRDLYEWLLSYTPQTVEEKERYQEKADALAEKVNDLDLWLCKGGAYPDEWSK